MFFYWPFLENNPKAATNENSNVTLKKEKKDLYNRILIYLIKKHYIYFILFK